MKDTQTTLSWTIDLFKFQQYPVAISLDDANLCKLFDNILLSQQSFHFFDSLFIFSIVHQSNCFLWCLIVTVREKVCQVGKRLRDKIIKGTTTNGNRGKISFTLNIITSEKLSFGVHLKGLGDPRLWTILPSPTFSLKGKLAGSLGVRESGATMIWTTSSSWERSVSRQAGEMALYQAQNCANVKLSRPAGLKEG